MREWLLRDPLASWRRIIDKLYGWGYVTLEDSIVHYAEELTGECVIFRSMKMATLRLDPFYYALCSLKNYSLPVVCARRVCLARLN